MSLRSPPRRPAGKLRRRMQSQLMLLTACVLLIAIGIYATYTWREQTALSRSSIETQAAALARNLAISSTDLMVLGSLDALDDLLKRSIDFPDVIELRISDEEGRLLSHFQRTAENSAKRIIESPAARLTLPVKATPQILTDAVQGNARLIAWHPVSAGDLLGWVRVDYSTTLLDDIRRRILVTTVVAALLAALGSSLLLFLFLRRPMRALEEARQFAVDLDQSGGRTLPPRRAPVEIEDLEAALNYASVSLHEQQRRLAETIALLRDHSEQLNAIFTLSPDGFVSFDAAHRVKYASPAFLRMTGLSEAEVLGLDEVGFVDRMARQCAAPQNFPSLNSMRAAATPNDLRHRSIELAVPAKRVIEVGLRVADAAGVSQILYFRDVTHETEVDQMKSEFIATAAHELRTPMSSILGYAELLAMQEFPAEDQREFIGTIHRQSLLMVSIINELLDLARIEARRGKDFKLEPLEVSELLQEIVGNLMPPESRAAPLIAPAAECWLHADRNKLHQAIGNVLNNAYKYSPAGGAVRIDLIVPAADGDETSAPQQQVGIRIRDEGIGMTSEQLGRVFERFYRADTSGRIPGTGLGMSIVKEIVELHGGAVELASTYGSGSMVTLWLPMTMAHTQHIE